jgi:SSS family solute:Na+ symporter
MTTIAVLDVLVIVAYLSGLTIYGSLSFRGQKNLKDFCLAGRSIGWLPVALALIASNLSANTLLGTPALVMQFDLTSVPTLFLFPFCSILVALYLGRRYYLLKVITVYEYLERRFDVRLRTLGSLLILLTKGGWLTLVLYTPSLALRALTGIPLEVSIVVIGLFSTLYATLGGAKAVIRVDTVQFFVLVGGTVLVLGAIVAQFGGDTGQIWHLAQSTGHTRVFNWSLQPDAEWTVWSCLAFSVVSTFYDYGFNQVVAQRYLSAKSVKDSVKGILANIFLVLPVIFILYAIGIGLVAFYEQNPAERASLLELDPSPKQAYQYVLPHFVAHCVPVGLSGLILAGILAATMSCVNAGVNSMATICTVDFQKRLLGRKHSEAGDVKDVRAWTVVWGLLATTGALFVGRLGTIFEALYTIYGFFTGPLVGVFLLGILARRASSRGALLGVLIGLATTALVAHFPTINQWWGGQANSPLPTVHYLWYGVIGCGATLLFGYLLSYPWRSAACPETAEAYEPEAAPPPEPA